MKANKSDAKTSLHPAPADYVTSAAKAVLGMVPFAGSLLSELAGSIIPNQRIERLAKFAMELEVKLSRLDQIHVHTQLADETFTDLMEEGIRQAARSISDERRQYLSSLLANGIASEATSYIESKHLLRLLGEINDIEVIWLRFYVTPTMGGDLEFRNKHKDILDPIHAHLGCNQDILDKKALQDSYKEHLNSLGLLKPRYEKDGNTRQPIFDSTGNPKVRGYDITPLGRLLIKQIDSWSESRT